MTFSHRLWTRQVFEHTAFAHTLTVLCANKKSSNVQKYSALAREAANDAASILTRARAVRAIEELLPIIRSELPELVSKESVRAFQNGMPQPLPPFHRRLLEAALLELSNDGAVSAGPIAADGTTEQSTSKAAPTRPAGPFTIGTKDDDTATQLAVVETAAQWLTARARQALLGKDDSEERSQLLAALDLLAPLVDGELRWRLTSADVRSLANAKGDA